MRGLSVLVAAASAALVTAGPITPRQDPEYVGYLLSTFTDPDPRVHWHLSDGNSATRFNYLNGGSPILGSTVGTKGVRDVFIATNPSRSEYFLIATGMSIFPQ